MRLYATLRSYGATARMNMHESMYFGRLYVMGTYALRGVRLIALLLLWKAIFAGKSVLQGFTLEQMLTYTLLAEAFSAQLNIRTAASDWLNTQNLAGEYLRPHALMGSIFSGMLGKWVPQLCLFSLPCVAIALVAGMPLAPVSLWFVPSWLLTVSLGYAMDILFGCLMIRMPNATYLVSTLRGALSELLSGAVIPFAVLPYGIGRFLSLQPFGSLAGAPLALYTGLEAAPMILVAQVLWNMVLWPFTLYVWRKSQERMVSFGG